MSEKQVTKKRKNHLSQSRGLLREVLLLVFLVAVGVWLFWINFFTDAFSYLMKEPALLIQDEAKKKGLIGVYENSQLGIRVPMMAGWEEVRVETEVYQKGAVVEINFFLPSEFSLNKKQLDYIHVFTIIAKKTADEQKITANEVGNELRGKFIGANNRYTFSYIHLNREVLRSDLQSGRGMENIIEEIEIFD